MARLSCLGGLSEDGSAANEFSLPHNDKLEVASSRFEVASSKFEVASSKFSVRSCEFEVLSLKLEVASSRLAARPCQLCQDERTSETFNHA